MAICSRFKIDNYDIVDASERLCKPDMRGIGFNIVITIRLGMKRHDKSLTSKPIDKRHYMSKSLGEILDRNIGS